MREITVTKTVEEIVGYEATDGTRFDSKEECERYEKTADAIIGERFNKLIISKLEECIITNSGSVPLCDVGECWNVGLVAVNSEHDVDIINMFAESVGSKSRVTSDDIGKQIVVALGEDDGNRNSWFYRYGTIEECIEEYREGLEKLTKN